jgi:hypothetical protein
MKPTQLKALGCDDVLRDQGYHIPHGAVMEENGAMME